MAELNMYTLLYQYLWNVYYCTKYLWYVYYCTNITDMCTTVPISLICVLLYHYLWQLYYCTDITDMCTTVSLSLIWDGWSAAKTLTLVGVDTGLYRPWTTLSQYHCSRSFHALCLLILMSNFVLLLDKTVKSWGITVDIGSHSGSSCCIVGTSLCIIYISQLQCFYHVRILRGTQIVVQCISSCCSAENLQWPPIGHLSTIDCVSTVNTAFVDQAIDIVLMTSVHDVI